jgi:4-amino-4-deoxy-L-arabinose transferase-like glycosyltransferase
MMTRAALLYAMAGLLALLSYFYGLDSRYIPKNGDESVYFHITRLTAQSGALLPLASELDQMRNTKPPLLFWQGMLATDWGQHWDLWRLRVPSVLYTMATALLVFLSAHKLTGSRQSGVVAVLCWLAFFSTYRYGRPFLTNPPEIFWLFAPFFVMLYWGKPAFESRWRVPVVLGLLIGIGLLYKSFALLLPVGLGLSLWHWHQRNFRIGEFLIQDAPKLALSSFIGLALFGLWFVFDPQPAAVWQEFVVGENAQKFNAEQGYVRTLLWGASSIWSMLLNYPLNAGLLAVPVAMLFFAAIRNPLRAVRNRAHAKAGQVEAGQVEAGQARLASIADVQRLWIWVAALFFVFVLPSQRSGRYLMPAMPAIAILLAVYWRDISRFAFVLSLLCALTVAAVLAYLSLQLQWAMPNDALFSWIHWLGFVLLTIVAMLGLFRKDTTRAASLAAVFLVYLCFSSTVRPLDGTLGQYPEATRQAVAGKEVRVPCNFRASYESHRFLLPGANVLGYDENANVNASAAQLATRFQWFAYRVPVQGGRCEGCKILGERLEIQSRHTPAQINEMLNGKLFENLFVRELLVESGDRRFANANAAIGTTAGTESECR